MCGICSMAGGICDFEKSAAHGPGGSTHSSTASVAAELQAGASPVATNFEVDGLDSRTGYFLPGRKWGEGELGTPGGVVTWSIADAGVDISDFTRFSTTFDPDDVYSFDVEAVIREAFAIWSAAANIEFIQVEDSGVGSTEGPVGNIRVLHGQPTSYERIGVAYFPNPTETGGNVVISDFSELRFDEANYLDLVLHELGHALGLGHTNNTFSIMFAGRLQSQTTLNQPDLNIIREIYGAQDDGPLVYHLPEGERDLSLIYTPDPVTVIGNALGNRLEGTAGAERMEGGGGNDWFSGEGGDDVLDGGAGFDTARIASVYAPDGIVFGETVVVAGEAGATLINTERIVFDDGVLALPGEELFSISGLYFIALGRAPDAGILFWQNRLADGLSIDAMATLFVNSNEFLASVADESDLAFLEALYGNLRGSSGDPDGVAFWQGRLADGVTRSEALLAFARSDEVSVRTAAPEGLFYATDPDDLI
ncbi:MAG: DUF4214 domain-containing protein [Pseudomonadota bacterium]